MEQGRVRIGVSGWRYAPWRGEFYPKSLRQAEELSYLASQLSTVEINGTFYSLQSPASFAAWHAATPEGFVFAVKGSRYLTHILRLKEFERPLANFFASGLFNLGEKLGPLLWQFPPNLRFEPDRFETFMAALPHDTTAALALARRRDARMTGRARLAIDAPRRLHHAFEIRNESFLDAHFIALLRRYGIALVVADTGGKWPSPTDVPAGGLAAARGDRAVPEPLQRSQPAQVGASDPRVAVRDTSGRRHPGRRCRAAAPAARCLLLL